MDFPDEYGPPNELKLVLDKFAKRMQKKIASGGGGGGCGCSKMKKKKQYNYTNLNNFTSITV